AGSQLLPYTTLFRALGRGRFGTGFVPVVLLDRTDLHLLWPRVGTRLNVGKPIPVLRDNVVRGCVVTDDLTGEVLHPASQLRLGRLQGRVDDLGQFGGGGTAGTLGQSD